MHDWIAVLAMLGCFGLPFVLERLLERVIRNLEEPR